MKRRVFSGIVLLAPVVALAQASMESTVIGVGPFEFPISGNFSYSKSNGATRIAVAGTDRTFTVGMFRGRGRVQRADRIPEFAALTQTNWERFAASENGKIVRQFKRTDITPGLAVLSMATEFGSGSSLQYYVQFAATTGDESAIIFAEGSGSAQSALSELEPLVERVRLVPR